MQHNVTDVSIYGARTVHFHNIVAAEAAYAEVQKDPFTVYAQLVSHGKIVRQYTKTVAEESATVVRNRREGSLTG